MNERNDEGRYGESGEREGGGMLLSSGELNSTLGILYLKDLGAFW